MAILALYSKIDLTGKAVSTEHLPGLTSVVYANQEPSLH